MSQRNKFNDPEYEIISMDVKKLYPNIDTKMPLKYIIEKIYEKTSDYFPKNNNEHGQIIFPPKKIFEKNFDEILHKFTAFECLSRYFRQKTGANTGGKISFVIANIFLSINENQIIPEWLENKKNLAYARYVDDTCISYV